MGHPDEWDLLTAAEAGGFDVFLTTDQNLRYQQRLEGRRIAIVVIGRPQWPIHMDHLHAIVAAVQTATPGSYTEVDLPA